MTAWLAAIALLGVSQDTPDRLRSIRPNGSVVFAERIRGAHGVTVQLWISTRRQGEHPASPGTVHLLEHLLLKRPELDRRLETAGMQSSGKTYRDALCLEVTCGPDQLPEAVSALEAIAKPGDWSATTLKSEVAILKQERAATNPDLLLGNAAWAAALGSSAHDPIGSDSDWDGVSGEALQQLMANLFVGRNLALTIAGAVDVDAATRIGSPFLDGFPKVDRVDATPRVLEASKRTELPGVLGECRAAIAPGYRETKAAALLAAALGIATQLPSAFVSYTPSPYPGLISVGQTGTNSGLGLLVDGLEESDMAYLFRIGKPLALRWVTGQMASPTANATVRGQLLSAGPSYRVEDMLEPVRSLTWTDFVAGIEAFRKEQAIVVVGLK